MTTLRPTRTSRPAAQDGFALIGLVVVIFIILITLSVAAPTVARALRREREVETVRRADEYVNAIRRYHLKTGAYPGSLEQLDKTNNIRYLRQKYNDPMTGKPDWRLIKVGENKTSVKGFFGQPLAGLATTGIGGSSGISGSTTGNSTSAAGGPTSNSGMTSSTSGNSTGASDASNSSGSSSNSSFGGSASSGGIGSGATGTGSTSGSSTAGAGVFGSQSASGFGASGSPFLGVGLPTAGSAIIVVNEQTSYPEWEFLYDPRVEQLRAKVNILGGGMSSSSSSSLGALSGSASSTPGGSSNPPVQPITPANSPQ